MTADRSNGKRARILMPAALSLLILLFGVLPAPARIGDGRLILRLKEAPGESKKSSRPVLADLLVQYPSGSETAITLPLHMRLQGGHEDHVLAEIPAGTVRVALRDTSRTVVRTWNVPVAPELTTIAVFDLGSGALVVDPVHPDPFGNCESWDRDDLGALPGTGAEAALSLDTRPGLPADPVLDGADFGNAAHLRPRGFNLEDDAALVQVPLGEASAAVGQSAPWIVTGGTPTGITALGSAETAGRYLGQGSATVRGHVGFLGLRGPAEVDGVFQGLHDLDEGPTEILDHELPNNGLTAVEARARAFFEPSGWGRWRADFYAYGQNRNYFLQEFAEDTSHNPHENQAGLTESASWDFHAGPAGFSLEEAFNRFYTEIGDGLAFNNLKNFQLASSGNNAVSSDSLYWRGTEFGTTPPHFYNYFEHDLTTSWDLRGEGRIALGAASPLRFGVDSRWYTWRWYQPLDPILAGQGGVGGGGYQDVSYLGYDLLGDNHASLPGHEPRKPQSTALYASQRLALGAVDFEAGARWERFSSGQQRLLSLSNPTGADPVLTPAELGNEPVRYGLDPRIGIHIGAAQWAHFWADIGQSRQDPPFEALYYSPNVVSDLGYLAQVGSLTGPKGALARTMALGNPDLKPEIQRAASVGFFYRLNDQASLRISGRAAQVRDTWVAVPVPSGIDTLNYYENRGARREFGGHVSLTYAPSRTSRFRVLYDLSRIDTNVIEPAPLYSALLLPGSPEEGLTPLETAPIEPVWLDPGTVDPGTGGSYHPSLFDHRHRIAAEAEFYVPGIGPAPEPGSRNLHLSVTVKAASGAPYTPIYIQSAGLMPPFGDALSPGTVTPDGINSARLPWTWQLDIGVRNELRFWGGHAAVTLDLENITDQKNVIHVYSATGDANDDGWLSTSAGATYGAEGDNAGHYQTRLDNPLNYAEGRTLRIAVEYGF